MTNNYKYCPNCGSSEIEQIINRADNISTNFIHTSYECKDCNEEFNFPPYQGILHWTQVKNEERKNE